MADWSNSGEGIWSGELLVSIVESLVLKEGLVVRVSFFFLPSQSLSWKSVVQFFSKVLSRDDGNTFILAYIRASKEINREGRRYSDRSCTQIFNFDDKFQGNE